MDKTEELIFKQVTDYKNKHKDFYNSYENFLPKYEKFQQDYDKFIETSKIYKTSTK